MYEFLKEIHFGKSAFYEPFPAEELHKILKKINTLSHVFIEMERVRQILIELEKSDYKVILLPKDRQQCISKFSQLFRALLIRRDMLIAKNSESESEDTLASDESSNSIEEELEIFI